MNMNLPNCDPLSVLWLVGAAISEAGAEMGAAGAAVTGAVSATAAGAAAGTAAGSGLGVDSLGVAEEEAAGVALGYFNTFNILRHLIQLKSYFTLATITTKKSFSLILYSSTFLSSTRILPIL